MLHLEHAGIYDRKEIRNEDTLGRSATKMLEQASILNIIQRGIALLISGASAGGSGVSQAQNYSAAKAEVRRSIARGKVEMAIDKMLHHAEKEQKQMILNNLYMLSGQWNRLVREQVRGTVSPNDLAIQHHRITGELIQLIEVLFD
jgi:Effector-associated domain 11